MVECAAASRRRGAGRASELSPGARIYGPNRTLVLSATLVGQTLPVRYVRDLQGLVHEVWLAREHHTAPAR